MAYTVLARKYRSQSFDDVIGQDPISKTLQNAIKTGRVAHAFLFVGTRGVGKTTMARILAKALNCHAVDEPTSEPCCKCQSCLAVNLGEDIDVIEIDGATNNGVEQVRELRQNAIYRPARSRYKIYVIDEVHMLSTSAFNALLKILEEPPSHVKFIFATTEPNKVIPTIQSRCQRFDFRNISPKLIAEQLKSILRQEKIKFKDDLVLPIARMANGSMRDGLSLLDRLISTGVEPLTAELLEEFLGCPNSEKICGLIAKIGDSDAAGTLDAIEDLVSTGLSEVQIVDSLVEYMRDLMVVKSAGTGTDLLILTPQQQNKIAELAEKFDIAAIIYNITALEKLRWAVKNSDTARALLDALMLRFALSEHFLNVDELLSQLSPGRPSNIKKNEIAEANPVPRKNNHPSSPTTDKQIALPTLTDIALFKNNWQEILNLFTAKLGNSTVALLSNAVPTSFENDSLTLTFSASQRSAKEMCQRNGRVEQLESVLGEHCRKNIKIKLDVGDEQVPAEQKAEKPVGVTTQMRNRIINDPAVKTVLMGLDATPIEIETEK